MHLVCPFRPAASAPSAAITSRSRALTQCELPGGTRSWPARSRGHGLRPRRPYALRSSALTQLIEPRLVGRGGLRVTRALGGVPPANPAGPGLPDHINNPTDKNPC